MTRVLYDFEKGKNGKPSLEQIREEILKHCSDEVKEKFYIDNAEGNKVIKHNSFTSLNNKTPITDDEKEEIKKKFEEYIKS